MNEQVAIQKFLHGKLTSLQAKNPLFSIRAFAKKAGVSPGTLSLILLGKRTVSQKLAARIADKLLLDPQERAELLGSFLKPETASPRTDSVDASYLQLTADQFHVVSEWRYFAILNLITLKEFKNNPTQLAARIGARLGLPRSAVTSAIERLKRLEMIQEDAHGRLSRTQTRFRTSDDVANASLRKSHHQTLELAGASLENDPIDRRDFTWLTFPIDTRKLPLAKTLIRKFQDDLLAALEPEADCDEVYRMAIQLFPLTKGKSK